MATDKPDAAPAGLHIFPTTDRGKHAKSVSYPVGAEALSRVLFDVPQAHLITCSFYGGGTAGNRMDRESHLILQASYSKRGRMFQDGPLSQERGVYDPKWHISVFAVPVAVRHAVKTLLINEALPHAVRSWFLNQSDIDTRSGGIALWLTYTVADGTISAEEHGKLDPERTGR